MTRIDYIRQLPGMENIDEESSGCVVDYAIDLDCKNCPRTSLGFRDCIGCMNEEATIGGEPAPYLFSCPVKPGQTVYRATPVGVFESQIDEIRFGKNGWYAVEYDAEDNEYGIVCDDNHWLYCIFPTREDAEEKLAEMRGDADGK